MGAQVPSMHAAASHADGLTHASPTCDVRSVHTPRAQYPVAQSKSQPHGAPAATAQPHSPSTRVVHPQARPPSPTVRPGARPWSQALPAHSRCGVIGARS